MKLKTIRIESAVRVAAGALLVAGGIASASALAGEKQFTVDHPLYHQECGSCHLAYPPQLLSAPSWRGVMGGLDKHFGTDASLDPTAQSDIQRFLERHAGQRDTSRNGKPLLRISDTRWFVHEHSEELPRNIWKNSAVKTAANCAACHTAAEKGDYSERTLRVPKGGRQ